MNIKDTIAAINQMQTEGIIRCYTIGGAVGATFVEAGALDTARFQDVVVCHGLEAAWRRFEEQFLGGKN